MKHITVPSSVTVIAAFLALALNTVCRGAAADVTLENARFRLVIGADAKAKSLVVKATGEECLDVREGIPLFSVTQDRPFNNEIKLVWPNKRTTYPANRLRLENGRLVVGFSIIPYEAVVGVKPGDGYLAFTLVKPIPAEGEVGEIFIEENPVDAMMWSACRVLGFGGEAFYYEGYTAERPYKFTGVKRGHYSTRAAAHPRGEVGGTLDVSEFAARSIYIDQKTSLQDEIAGKIKKIYDCGFEFCYFDGSEGVAPPCGVNVALAQYRVTSKFAKPPIFTEGAAKSHFGWHLQAGANAFDVFLPEIFKAMIVRFPQDEAPIMRQDMTRIDFGWWGVFAPGQAVWDKTVKPYVKHDSVGTQPDMWEFGTSRAAAWDCPVTIQMLLNHARIPRFDDLLDVLRRWEDVRAKNWLTQAQKEALKSPTQEHHLYLNGKGEYELHEIKMLPPPPAAPQLRGFVFERNGKRYVAYWHTCGSGTAVIALGDGGATLRVPADRVRYLETVLSREETRRAFAAASMKKVQL